MVNQKKLGIAVIIENQKGEFLLHLRDQFPVNLPNQWSLIGGGVEHDEQPEEAVVREVKEETNLSITKTFYLKKIAFDDKWDAIIFHAQVDLIGQEIKINEGKKLKFFSKNEVLNLFKRLKYSNPFLEVLKEYIKI